MGAGLISCPGTHDGTVMTSIIPVRDLLTNLTGLAMTPKLVLIVTDIHAVPVSGLTGREVERHGDHAWPGRRRALRHRRLPRRPGHAQGRSAGGARAGPDGRGDRRAA